MQDNLVGQNIIITERISVLRQLGRNALKGKWKIAIAAVIIYVICSTVPPMILNNYVGLNPVNVILENSELSNYMDPDDVAQISNSTPNYSILSFAYIVLITGPFTLGLSLFFLALFRGHDVKPKDVFLGFERFGKSLGLFLYMALFIFLWYCLFIIPGIIAAIRYSQAFYVLADDPKKSIRECMNESKLMMKGNKSSYFLLNLSFIGWFLLASIPGSFIVSIAGSLTDSFPMIALASIISNLLLVPVFAYMFSAEAGFYEILAGHLIKDTAPAPVTPDQIDVAAPIEHIEEVIESVEEASNDASTSAVEEETTELSGLDIEAKVPETTDLEEGMPKEPSIDFEGIFDDPEKKDE